MTAGPSRATPRARSAGPGPALALLTAIGALAACPAAPDRDGSGAPEAGGGAAADEAEIQASSAPGRDAVEETEAADEADEVAPIPEAFSRGPAPHLFVDEAEVAIDYYEDVFGAKKRYRALGPEGEIVHAALAIGDSTLTLSEAAPDAGSHGPGDLRGAPAWLHLYVDDAEGTYARAVDAGGSALDPVSYQFWGDRRGRLADPFGHMWSIATRVSNVSESKRQELAERLLEGGEVREPEGAKPRPIPEAYGALTPLLAVDDVGAAISFYERAFGAELRSRIDDREGDALGAEIRIRDQIVVLGRAGAEGAVRRGPDPHAAGGTPVIFTYYVKDAERALSRALGAGAEARIELQEMFWGDRWAEIEDPFGHVWALATRVEHVPDDELEAQAPSAESER